MIAQEGDAHVVAGAREMMRYRRNRASTMEGQQTSSGGVGGGGVSSGGLPPHQQQLPTHGMGYGVGAGAGGAPWAMYQTNGKPSGPPAQSHMPVSFLSRRLILIISFVRILSGRSAMSVIIFCVSFQSNLQCNVHALSFCFSSMR